ncbi:ribosome biogenesis GTPase YqeH [Facklamia sp. DSM 111018]|uniref:Ribosome biogenesis GTPase YqeH n=1 Tax=Facklamia lactis TaxID=2749967 RepID=A0ABS0LRD4_9LACT|nr:ribosome biogenesis GTPase YqeH [Facklamia lactis]MBG9980912.1 ribosome biogenesis GTPase YqeH [Facklamia lactis]MBG9986725.1 ribosome biogenesis GTPase YqeH [Facklamia lactis]
MSQEIDETTYQCIGCGIPIQSADSSKLGYLPLTAFTKGLEQGQFYCQRCFRLRNYNEIGDLSLSDDLFLEKLSTIAEDEAFVVMVVDIFDVEGSIIAGLSRFIGNQPFIVVANKMDLLPKSVKPSKIIHWLKEILYQMGLKPAEIFLLSANKRNSLEPLIEMIDQEVRHKNVYIVGVTNVGKSTLINQLIQHYGGEKEIITTSNVPGTTLDLIHIPLTDTTGIVDTPGIIRDNQLAHFLDRKGMKVLLPSKPIKPRTFQMNSGQTLFVGGVARIDFVSGQKTAFTFYLSNEAYLHRTKLEVADEFYDKHQGGLLSPPYKDQQPTFPELYPKDLNLEENQDLAISGLGWLTANHKVNLRVWLPKGVGVSIRKSMI